MVLAFSILFIAVIPMQGIELQKKFCSIYHSLAEILTFLRQPVRFSVIEFDIEILNGRYQREQ